MEVKDRIDELIRDDMELGKEIIGLEKRFCTETAMLRQKIKELGWVIENELNRLKEHRDKLRDEILKLWKDNYDEETTLALPSAKVSRRNYRELVIKDKTAIVNVLDRIDRLDLVDYVLNEKEVAKLSAKGKLPGVPKKAMKVIDHYKLQVRPAKGKRK